MLNANNKSSILLFLVGFKTCCNHLQSYNVLTDLLYRPSTDFKLRVTFGRLKSLPMISNLCGLYEAMKNMFIDHLSKLVSALGGLYMHPTSR